MNRTRTHTRRTPALPRGEQRLLRRILPLCGDRDTTRYPVGIGDDCAVRACRGGERLVLTTDSMVEGVHFSFNWMSPREVGRKCMAANFSDCASMGAMPESALVELLIPRGADAERTAAALYRGFGDLCRPWRCAIVGGNIATAPCWTISVTLIGLMPSGVNPLLRANARPGDTLWVTGSPGMAGAGLAALQHWGRRQAEATAPGAVRKHIAPIPRIRAGAALARNPAVHAMMDISDGVALDAQRLATSSRCAVVLEPERFAVSGSMRRLGQLLSKDPSAWFLEGGEDYELLFAAGPSFDPTKVRAETRVTLTRIGVVNKGAAGLFIRTGERLAKLHAGGWDHLQ
jgi:thiamine-monophosphate kinase